MAYSSCQILFSAEKSPPQWELLLVQRIPEDSPHAHTHTHMKTCRLTEQKNIDSQNRRLDVVGIRNPVKALDEWKGRCFTGQGTYWEGCFLRPISNRPMSGTVKGRWGRKTCGLSSVFRLWFRKLLEHPLAATVGAAFRRKEKAHETQINVHKS